jgi:hypothetical protein
MKGPGPAPGPGENLVRLGEWIPAMSDTMWSNYQELQSLGEERIWQVRCKSPLAMRVFALLLVSAVLGCTPATGPGSTGDDDGPIGNNLDGGTGSGSGSASVSATEFVTALDHGYCDEAWVCKSSYPSGADVSFSDAYGNSNQQCYDYALAYEQNSVIDSEIAAGHITYDPIAAAQCLATITYPSSCSTFWNNGPDYPTACTTALVGTAQNGASCLVDWDCADFTAYCDTSNHHCSTN